MRWPVARSRTIAPHPCTMATDSACAGTSPSSHSVGRSRAERRERSGAASPSCWATNRFPPQASTTDRTALPSHARRPSTDPEGHFMSSRHARVARADLIVVRRRHLAPARCPARRTQRQPTADARPSRIARQGSRRACGEAFRRHHAALRGTVGRDASPSCAIQYGICWAASIASGAIRSATTAKRSPSTSTSGTSARQL